MTTTMINTANSSKSMNTNSRTASGNFMTELFSAILETEVTTRQAFLLIHAFCSWCALMISAVFHPVVALLMLVWFIATVVQVSRSGLRIPEE